MHRQNSSARSSLLDQEINYEEQVDKFDQDIEMSEAEDIRFDFFE
jgi:hypothetical protein